MPIVDYHDSSYFLSYPHNQLSRQRTLVTIASCAFMLVSMDIYHGSDAEARIMYSIITGMGFIGGGAIFKDENGAKGTATAAGLWNTAAIAISVAYGRYEIAIILDLLHKSSLALVTSLVKVNKLVLLQEVYYPQLAF